MSLTTSMIFDFRTANFDDSRSAQLFGLVDTFTEIVESAAGQMLEVCRIFRSLPDLVSSVPQRAEGNHVKEKRLFNSLYMNVKENKDSKPCFCTDMAKVQEREGFSDDLAA